jgi:hypothetical protein
MWTKGLAFSWAGLGSLTLIVVAVYCVIQSELDTAIDDASDVCDKDFPTYDYFKNPPSQSLQVCLQKRR